MLLHVPLHAAFNDFMCAIHASMIGYESVDTGRSSLTGPYDLV